MNCDKDFHIRYNNTYVKVRPFCESSLVHYKVYLPEGEIKVQPYSNDNGESRWREYNKGESPLAIHLGRLIEEQENEDSKPINNSIEEP